MIIRSFLKLTIFLFFLFIVASCSGGGGGGGGGSDGGGGGELYTGVKAPDVFSKDTTNVKPHYVNPNITGLTGNSIKLDSARINTSTSYDFYFYNENNEALTLDVSLQGGDLNCFTLDKSTFTSTIPGKESNNSNTFTIRFNPSTTGLKTTKLVIKGKFSGEKVEIDIKANSVIWDYAFNSPEGNGDDRPLIGVQDSNGNIIIAGFGHELINSSSGNDGWIKKFSSSGDYDISLDIHLSFTSDSQNDKVRNMAIDSNNNLFVSNGDVWTTANMSINAGKTMKILPSGEVDTTWQYEKGGYVVVSPQDDSIFVIGRYFVTKLDQSGNVLWERDISVFYKNTNSVYDGKATHGVCDSQGNIYIGGYNKNIVNTGSQKDWKIVKYTSDGILVTTGWDNIVYDASSNNDIISSMIVDQDDNLYVAAKGEDLISGTSEDDFIIKKYSSDGTEDTSWNKIFDDAYFYDPDIKLFMDASNNITVILEKSDVEGDDGVYDYRKIIKYDVAGNNLYEKDFQSANRNNVTYVFPGQNGYVFMGYQDNRVSANSDYDWRIKKYDTDGKEM